MNEAQLIEQLKSKDAAAFKQLVDIYQDRVYNTVLSFLQHPIDAEDVAQEVFVEIYHSIGQFKGASKLSTWMYKVAVSKAMNWIRKKKSKKRFAFLQPILGEREDKGLGEISNFQHPGISLEQKEAGAMIFKAIQLLPENQQVAFILSKIEGLSQQEIAQVMGVTIASVEAYLHRAKQSLRHTLKILQS